MLVLSRREQVDPLLETGLDLVERSDREGEQFPHLRVGIARGQALGRAGDCYGRPVNLASRITAFARPGSILTTNEVHDAASGAYAWSRAGIRRFKGIREPVALMRLRRVGSTRGGD